MAKTNNKNLIYVVLIVAAVIALYGYQQGWFNIGGTSTLNPNATSSNLPSGNPNSGAVNLWFNPNTICTGSAGTAYISAPSLPNGICRAYAFFNGAWDQFGAYTLNANGITSVSQQANTAGTTNFKVNCCANNQNQNCQDSNQASLTVNSCNQNQQQVQATCTDTDFLFQDDVQPTLYGYCQSSVTNTGLADVCASLTSVSEKYCGDDKTCKSQTISCPKGWACIDGACKIPRCQDVANPLDQSYCDPASDPQGSGMCYFWPASLTLPARCSHQVPT